MAADPALANGPVTLKVIRSSIRRSHASVSVGVLSACLTPIGGLWGGASEANHRLCQLGCQNMVLTPYHRARLELMRRSMDRLLGPHSHLGARIDGHDDLFVCERSMTDDQLVDVEQYAIAAFLAGYRGLTRDAYALDLRQFIVWCQEHKVRLFAARRADIECFARDLEARGRARATVARRLCTVAASTVAPSKRGC